MSKYKQAAQDFINLCNKLGWHYTTKGSIIEITKLIKAEDRDDFVKADMEYGHILSAIPQTSAGSIWGTDGGGIGALAAMNSGVFRIKKSGCSKNVLKWVDKLSV